MVERWGKEWIRGGWRGSVPNGATDWTIVFRYKLVFPAEVKVTINDHVDHTCIA